ncbi:O-antigen ligase family protein [uncultured Mycobacterium sp.]|uniref:O-antigen ligase family protein n=1 Tax=uncultured Mycobacterium sp. TaxID=171292 RepID=UPI0035C9EBB4
MKSATTATVASKDIPGAVAFPPWLSKTAVGCFLVASFTATWGGIYVGGIQTADIFLVLTFIITLAMVVFGNLRFVIPWWLWAPGVALFMCFTALIYSPIPDTYFGLRYQYASILATEPSGGVKSAFWLVGLLVVPIAAIACTALDTRVPKWIVAWFLAGVAISSLIALTDLTNLTHVSRDLTTTLRPGHQFDNNRQTGLTDHPNTLGLVCTIAVPFAVHFISESRRRWLPCIALVLLCGGVVASGSRGAQVVFPAALLAAILVSPHKKKVVGWLAASITAAILGGLTALAELAPGILDKLFRFDENRSSVGSNAERTELHAQAWNDFKSYPIFGIGIKHITEAHCIYLQMLSTGGSVLVAGMLIYWFGTLRSCWLAKRSGEALGAYLMLSVIVLLVIDVLENHLTDRFLYYTIGCAAALAATTGSRHRQAT